MMKWKFLVRLRPNPVRFIRRT